MAYLLDTCALSELTKPQINQGFLVWFKQQEAKDLFVSSMTLGELEKGVLKLPSSRKRAALMGWLSEVEQGFGQQCLGFDRPAAKTWATMNAELEKKGLKMAAFDSIIAAIASHHQLTLVTRNVKDFTATPVELLNPWHSQ